LGLFYSLEGQKMNKVYYFLILKWIMFRRFLAFLRDIWKVIKIYWYFYRIGSLGVHYHIVGFRSQEEYKIIWTELHKAHLIYMRRLRGKMVAAKRERTKDGKFK
jgi:hypothetical protein